MRFFRDDLAVEVPVRWYYVPAGRPVIPFGHPFGNRDWEFIDGDPGLLLGEVYGSRRYYGGQDPVNLLGQGFCGSREQWERGASTLDPVRPINPTTGRQCCCGQGVLQGTPGILFGVDSELTFPPIVAACPSANPASQFWTFPIAGVQDLDFPCNDTSLFNQTWEVAHLSACIWRGPSVSICNGGDSFRWHLIFNHPSFPGVWSLFAATTVVSFRWARYQIGAGAFAPLGANVLSLQEELDPALQFPSTVTITPAFS